MAEFIRELDLCTEILKSHSNNCLSVSAGCDLFTRFVTRTAGESVEDFGTFKQKLLLLIKDGFGEKSLLCKEKIADLAMDFIQDDSTILIHAYSKVVLTLLLKAASSSNRRFKVLVTEARPTNRGIIAAQILQENGIPATVILDSSVGYYIGKCDMVIVGAEGVVENGGIINQIGTYLISVMAKESNVPFYAAVENYKFVRAFPLSQYDLPIMSADLLYNSGKKEWYCENGKSVYENNHPTIDYTPPDYISLLFTDVGVLTPSAVSDELIKMYF